MCCWTDVVATPMCNIVPLGQLPVVVSVELLDEKGLTSAVVDSSLSWSLEVESWLRVSAGRKIHGEGVQDPVCLLSKISGGSVEAVCRESGYVVARYFVTWDEGAVCSWPRARLAVS